MYRHLNPALKKYNQIMSETEALFHLASQKMGLSNSAMQILYTVCDYGGRCYLSEISRINAISRQTVNSSIRRLEKDGIVKLEKGEGRRLYVCLTPSGREFANERVMPLLNAESELLAEWSEQDVCELIRLTERYRSDLENKIADLDER